MSDENPTRTTDATTPEGVEGTTEGDAIAGVRINEDDREDAVVPDDSPQEVDGPAQSHP